MSRLADLGFKSYNDYLKSRHWQAFRAEYLRANPGIRCFLCKCAGPIQLHHHDYDRLGRELPQDIIPLCSKCHVHVEGLIREGVGRANAHFVAAKRKAPSKAPGHYVGNWRQLVNKSLRQSVGKLQAFLQVMGFLDGVTPTKKAYQRGLVKDIDGKPRWHRTRFIAMMREVRKEMKRMAKERAAGTA